MVVAFLLLLLVAQAFAEVGNPCTKDADCCKDKKNCELVCTCSSLISDTEAALSSASASAIISRPTKLLASALVCGTVLNNAPENYLVPFAGCMFAFCGSGVFGAEKCPNDSGVCALRENPAAPPSTETTSTGSASPTPTASPDGDGSSGSSSAACSSMPPLAANPQTQMLSGSTWRVPLSTTKQIFVIESEDEEMFLGRSYDGLNWESSPGAPSSIFSCCASKWCTVTLPKKDKNNVKYKLWQVPVAHTATTAAPGSPASIARLLTQGTFGPTRAEMNSLEAKMSASSSSVTDLPKKETAVIKEWIQEQINLPPSLHRSYWRLRTNPRIFRGVVLPTGSSREPCSKGSRWKRYIFDETDKELTIVAVLSSEGFFSLTIDGVLRGVVQESAFGMTPAATRGTTTNLLVCQKQPGQGDYLQEWVGGVLKLSNANDCDVDGSIVTAKNPSVAFDSANVPDTLQVVNANDIVLTTVKASWGVATKDDVVLDSVTGTTTCKVGLEYIQVDANGPIYSRDYRMEMVSNTLFSPADNTISKSTMSGTCPSVPISFVNRKTCVRRPSCAPLAYQSKTFTLDRPTLRNMYKGSGKLLYVAAGLRLESTHTEGACVDRNGRGKPKKSTPASCSPCESTKSRWTRTAFANSNGCVSATTVDAGTKSTVEAAIAAAIAKGDSNPHVIDIDLKTKADTDGTTCDAAASFAASVVSNGVCYTHVHSLLFSVVDATYWNLFHPGNLVNNRVGRMPIKEMAETGATEVLQTTLTYPASHPMTRWRDAVFGKQIWEIGRLDDTVDFALLPVDTQDVEIAKVVGAIGNSVNDATHLACGSPGEVGNDPALGSQYGLQLVYGNGGVSGRFDKQQDPHKTEAKKTVWNMQALYAKDQLRQRVAWSLSQIFVISTIGALDVKNGQTEVWTAFYDIFVRHGLGNYFDVVKEVTYSPMMGTYLTFKDSKSFAVSGLPPDENYARELMQLFTIGLWKLNIDGSFALDEKGEKIETYNNANIQNFARVWTGFRQQSFRGNLEAHRARGSTNFVDPMKLAIQNHDTLPKLGLNDEYIGDGVQLCTDIPKHSFLKKNARFENVGTTLPHDNSIPGDLDPTTTVFKYGPNQRTNEQTTEYKRLVLETTSPLFQALCAPVSVGGACTFPSEVSLPSDLACHGRECFLDKEALYVKMVDSTTNEYTFYLFVQPLCVRMAFYDNPKMLALTHNAGKTMCGDPMEAAGGAACCFNPQVGGYFGFERCEYHLEKLTWDKAVSRCTGIIDDSVQSVPPGPYDMQRFYNWFGGQENPTRQLEICKKREGASRLGLRTIDGCGYNYRASWIDEPCSVQVQVDRFGRINIVHSGSSEKEVQLDSGNVFGVHWKNNIFPLATTGTDACGGASSTCSVHGTNQCLCDFKISNTPIFNSKGDEPLPTALEVVRKLKIGSPEVSTFGAGAYTKCVTVACLANPKVEVYLKNNKAEWDAFTIFKTFGPVTYLFNRLSEVKLGSGADAHSFRNVPHFMSLKNPSSSDMTAEIDATFEMLVKHENTPPFVARRLIKHLVTSNPSPRYIQVVATAFKNGLHDGLGSGKYGCMAATVAAILLDSEARNTVMDAEPTFGKIREPQIKLMHLLRSLEFKSGADGLKEVVLKQSGIGISPYHSPSVFNYYLPDHQPSGSLGKIGLTAPEMMLGTAPYLLFFLNGAASLIKYGLTNGGKGFGTRSLTMSSPVRDTLGSLTFSPTAAATDASAVIDELDLVMTSGRLDKTSHDIITAAYQDRLVNPPVLSALDGVELKLHETNYNCAPNPVGVRFRIKLQQGTTVKTGCSPFCYMRKGDKEIKVKVNHFAWVGNSMFIYDKLGFTCEKFQEVFQPGDVISVSSNSIVDGPMSALKLAQTLMTATTEFHATSMNARSNKKRVKPPTIATQNRKYKAIVVVYASGGADSWNYLVPKSGCTHDGSSFDLFNEYTTQRGAHIALKDAHMKVVTSPNDGPKNTQPCTKFGIINALPAIQNLYEAGDATFIANVGALVEPLDKNEYQKKTKRFPPSIGAHNMQQRESKTVHSRSPKKAKGVLGRIVEALTQQKDPFAAAGFSMHGIQSIFEGKYPPSIVGQNGVEAMTDEYGQTTFIQELLESESEHRFSETFAHLLNRSIADNALLVDVLAAAPQPTQFGSTASRIEREMKNVAKVILARASGGRENEREVFFISEGGFDSHFEAMIPGSGCWGRTESINKAIENFEAEMKAEGIWDDVVLVSSSDFGRKLVANSGGTDHGWGGHSFVAGGSIKGKQILGKYPSRLDDSSEHMVFNSKGRFIPTTPWEAVWSPIASWFGVKDEHMAEVFPNAANFPDSVMFTKSDMFE